MMGRQKENRMNENAPDGPNPPVAHPLLGTWRLISYVVMKDTGERLTPYGAHPTGYLAYSADGRMQVVGTADGRGRLRRTAPTDTEQAELLETMFAYAGTYTLAPGKVTHHVDISWNEIWTGTDQERFFTLRKNILTITSRATDPAGGAASEYVLVWEKVD
jgi:hypothetical protein